MNEINKITNKFIKGNWKLKPIDKNYEFYKDYLKTKTKDNLNYKTIIDTINNSDLTTHYINTINNYNDKIIKQSDIHGIAHVIRTSIFLLIISILEKTNIEDFQIILESILYHDIGRTNDIDDDRHGYEATKKIGFLKEKYNQNDFILISALITAHCIDDDLY